MAVYAREDEYIRLLAEREMTVRELAARLFVSEPTVRRDIAFLRERGTLSCTRGVVRLKTSSPDRRIPMFLRDPIHREEKNRIAAKAARLIRDGDVVMLDASSTALCLLPYLAAFRDLFVITSGAKAALTLADMGICTVCIGGEMIAESFSYIGPDAERTLKNYNADVAFFSCLALSEGGIATDSSIMENKIRQIMMKNAKRSYLLCDSSKLNKTCLHTLCHVGQLDGVLCDAAVEAPLAALGSFL